MYYEKKCLRNNQENRVMKFHFKPGDPYTSAND